MFVNIRLCEMSRFLNRTYFRKFVYDPDVFEDMSKFRPYRYNRSCCDAYWQRQRDMGRVHFAVMRGFVPIGEVILKISIGISDAAHWGSICVTTA